MTTFKEPLYIGQDTGASSTSTKAPVPFVRIVRVCGGAKNTTITIPDNCALLDCKAVVIQGVNASAGTGVNITVGTSAAETLYATVSAVSGSAGSYPGKLGAGSVSAAGVVVIKSTTQAGTAADYSAGKFNVNLIFVVRA